MDPRSACAASTMPLTTAPTPGEPDATPTIPAAAIRWRSTGCLRCGSRSTCCATTRRSRASTASVFDLADHARPHGTGLRRCCAVACGHRPGSRAARAEARRRAVGSRRRRLSPGGSSRANWGEWNDRYRDTRTPILAWRCRHGRRTCDAHRGLVRRLRPRAGDCRHARSTSSPPTTASRSRDLVSFERKHNEANGEINRDGTDANLSWNHGVEGASARPGDRGARAIATCAACSPRSSFRAGRRCSRWATSRAARRTATTTPTRRTTRQRGSTGQAMDTRPRVAFVAYTDRAAASPPRAARRPVASWRAGRRERRPRRGMAACRRARHERRRLGASGRARRRRRTVPAGQRGCRGGSCSDRTERKRCERGHSLARSSRRIPLAANDRHRAAGRRSRQLQRRRKRHDRSPFRCRSGGTGGFGTAPREPGIEPEVLDRLAACSGHRAGMERRAGAKTRGR